MSADGTEGIADDSIDDCLSCFVCRRAAPPGSTTLLPICACKMVHAACMQQHRQVVGGTAGEVLCVECGQLYNSLPCHLAADEARGLHHFAVVELRLPDGRGPTLCGVLSGDRGGLALRDLVETSTRSRGPWAVCAVWSSATSDVEVRLTGWDKWSWAVYCIAVTQAAHGIGRHRVEVTHAAGGAGCRPAFYVE